MCIHSHNALNLSIHNEETSFYHTSQVNEGVRSVENTEHLEWIQSHVQMTGLTETLTFNSQTNHMGYRKILHWGRVFKLRGNRDLLCFLFNDFLLFCKPKHSFTRPATPSDFEPFGNVQYLLYKKVRNYYYTVSYRETC